LARRGTGLGLPPVNRLIKLHGGRLELHSEPGSGTRATLAFPLGA
jgi:signal transduction histidine kinase